ncbi:hypothetical protein CRE_12357 [Caenorhabditis remanei]|nr:hypothetical protein CRE_12357 [Caenorhabditis remanei]
MATLLPSLVNFASIVLFLLIWIIFAKTENSNTIAQYKAIVHISNGYNLFMLIYNAVIGPKNPVRSIRKRKCGQRHLRGGANLCCRLIGGNNGDNGEHRRYKELCN